MSKVNIKTRRVSHDVVLEILMACLRLNATRLENKKELKLYTWKHTRFSAIDGPATQVGSVTRLLFGSVGDQASPMKTAKVNREFTLTIPSSAVMWIAVPNLVDVLPPPSTSILGFVGRFGGV
ncbi:hypothetical protein Hanom_Chr07g00673441 [Helianthus anomalus]